MPKDNNEHHIIDDVSTNQISHDIQPLDAIDSSL